jgi:hypothetical protein
MPCLPNVFGKNAEGIAGRSRSFVSGIANSVKPADEETHIVYLHGDSRCVQRLSSNYDHCTRSDICLWPSINRIIKSTKLFIRSLCYSLHTSAIHLNTFVTWTSQSCGKCALRPGTCPNDKYDEKFGGARMKHAHAFPHIAAAQTHPRSVFEE